MRGVVETVSAIPTPTGEAYDELQAAFDHYNRALFEGALPPCLITMQREKRTYGYFSFKRFVHSRSAERTVDEIAMNPAFFAVSPLQEILQTLVHEMTHLWQYHFGTPGRRAYHNAEWAAKMEAIGLMPSHTGRPGGRKTGEKMSDYPIEGGAFLAATETLLKGGFLISWLDRMPYRTVEAPPASALHAPAPAEAMPEEHDVETAIVVVEDATVRTTMVRTMGDAVRIAIEQPCIGNRSNRVKFRCPSCGAQAWGKPSLRLLCGEAECQGARYAPVA
jgi:hypothetical protein